MSRFTRTIAVWAAGPFLLLAALPAARAQDDTVMKALRDELGRSMKQLQLEKLEKPYFIAYHVQERRAITASATFGALVTGNTSRARYLSVEVRVGDYALDNSNFMSYPLRANGLGGGVMLPLDDDYQELRRQIWLATDSAYKAAVETLSKKRAALENRTTRESIPDFSKEEPVTGLEPWAPVKMDLAQAETLVRSLSALFRHTPDVFTSSVSLEASDTRSWYVNSEGTVVSRQAPVVSFAAYAGTQAADGMSLGESVLAYARSIDELPKESELAARIRAMTDRLAQARKAPLIDRYNGPILFDGQAAAELFSQVLAPKLIATRLPVSDNPQFEAYAARSANKFQDRLGARVLPDFLGVVDDPTQRSDQGTPLLGGHAVDDEGVRTRPTTLVEKGILKTLLTTRDPVPGILRSTGSRRAYGAEPSNLVVAVGNGASEKALKDKLISMAKQRNKEFGIKVTRVGAAAYKVYADGHEELIRQGEFDGLDDTAFKDMAAASKELTVYSIPFAAFGGNLYTGQAGAPLVSFVVPSLLFEDVTLKPPSGELPKLPLSKHPFFEK